MKIWLLVATLVFATGVSAQTPYAGMQTRSIKALSDQQIADQSKTGASNDLAGQPAGYDADDKNDKKTFT